MPGIINGRNWLLTRRCFLQDELAKDPDEGRRKAMEAELAAVEQELTNAKGRWWRMLLWGSRPPI